jgi:hypothetical protein
MAEKILLIRLAYSTRFAEPLNILQNNRAFILLSMALKRKSRQFRSSVFKSRGSEVGRTDMARHSKKLENNSR